MMVYEQQYVSLGREVYSTRVARRGKQFHTGHVKDPKCVFHGAKVVRMANTINHWIVQILPAKNRSKF